MILEEILVWSVIFSPIWLAAIARKTGLVRSLGRAALLLLALNAFPFFLFAIAFGWEGLAYMQTVIPIYLALNMIGSGSLLFAGREPISTDPQQ
tara:strand:- start:153 stop:434 length:282 start_codon:yes stop_codon:yes gene_type:complete